MRNDQESRSSSNWSGSGCYCGECIEWGCGCTDNGEHGGAFVTDVATSTMENVGGRNTDMDCAPDNFLHCSAPLVEMGGWLLILVVIIPMVLGWFLPGPVKMKGRDKHPNHFIR